MGINGKTISSRRLRLLIRSLLTFPQSKICRHAVCLDILSLMEEEGCIEMNEEYRSLVRAIASSDDDAALKLMNSEAK